MLCYVLRSARLAPQPPPAAGSEVYVVVMDRTGADAAGAALRIERCPAGCTRAELAERLAARAVSPAHLRVLVRPPTGARAPLVILGVVGQKRVGILLFGQCVRSAAHAHSTC